MNNIIPRIFLVLGLMICWFFIILSLVTPLIFPSELKYTEIDWWRFVEFLFFAIVFESLHFLITPKKGRSG